MRNRHISPEIQHYSSFSLLSPSHNNRLKMVGSTSKLRTYNSSITSQSQRKIGNYTYDLVQQIGSGYSSKVYRGTSREAECAVKVIQLKKYTQQSLKMLDNEIKILKTLDHPNVIKCYDIYKTATHCYIITQYCSNGDLLNYLTRRGKLQESVSLSIMTEIMEGVKYLLRKGIIHRDLKPANILNNKKHWKIADFGFAIEAEGQIKTKYNVGTPLYMPLEALVKNIYSPLSDIFSVGVIFYELLTGITPWECKNQKQLIKKMNSLPYTLSDRFKISSTTRCLLTKLCSIDPDLRLSKSDFLDLNLSRCSQVTVEERCSSKLLLERSQSDLGELIKSSSSSNILVSKSVLGEKQVNDRQQTRNNHILISQLHYCRFIYYLTRNINFLLVTSRVRAKLSLFLYKHLQRLIKQLSDNQHNWFGLNNWDVFKESKKYYSTFLTMKQYANRYEKQYLNFLKKTELNIVRQINKQLSELSSADSLTITFYRRVQTFLAPILRQANHNTTIRIHQEPETKTPETKGNIEALRSLFKYFRLVDLSMNQFQNYDCFEKKSSIKVQIDFKNAPNSCLEQFGKLRQQLKFI